MPALRGDLLVTQQLFEGRSYYVVKDPISLQYFRMTAEDYFLATLFDGKRTFGKVRELYVARHRHVLLEYSPEELNERVLRFANDLALLQFLTVQGQRLKARYDAVRQRKAKKPLQPSHPVRPAGDSLSCRDHVRPARNCLADVVVEVRVVVACFLCLLRGEIAALLQSFGA